MYKNINFEISGFCNAKCPWCVTGNSPDKGWSSLRIVSEQDFHAKEKIREKPFIDVDVFANAIDHMLELNMIGKDTCINLYNWGEPLIHPRFNEIVNVLLERNLFFGLSTNASHLVKLNNNAMKKLMRLEISMPGFSQSSYDKIHGFQFHTILSNIDKIIHHFRQSGYIGQPNLVYHIYQFNINEIKQAVQFAKSRKFLFLPYAAYLNDYEVARSYLNKTMHKDVLQKVSRELLMYYVDDHIMQMPNEYSCPQFDYLSIDEKCNILTCCVLPKTHKDYSLGNLFDVNINRLNNMKRSQEVCKTCIESGLSYWAHNTYTPDFVVSNVKNNIFLFFANMFPKSMLRTLRNVYYNIRTK
ncbi:MAG: radical SAM protein [Mariprofundales bacterium]